MGSSYFRESNMKIMRELMQRGERMNKRNTKKWEK